MPLSFYPCADVLHAGPSVSRDEPEDAVLAAAARAHPPAFARLYERYLGPVYRFCHVRLGSKEAAEDATSEIFLKAFSGLGGFRDGMFAAWLFRIAQNVVTDTYRRRRPAAPLDEAGSVPDPRPAPDAEALAAAEREALQEALATLTQEQRLAVELGLAGWSGEQIAAVLEKSPAAVKMLRFRALERLRATLGPSLQEPDAFSGGAS
jgi:RNA polymerase sigma-70 factor, ECF subfamily